MGFLTLFKRKENNITNNIDLDEFVQMKQVIGNLKAQEEKNNYVITSLLGEVKDLKKEIEEIKSKDVEVIEKKRLSPIEKKIYSVFERLKEEDNHYFEQMMNTEELKKMNPNSVRVYISNINKKGYDLQIKKIME